MRTSQAAPAPEPTQRSHSPLSPAEIMDRARARETALSRILMAFISFGMVFMLLPGTFLGVWNLLQISGRESVGMVSPAWLQAHGHAQVFGWIGSFILGIGFYSVPLSLSDARDAHRRPRFGAAWTSWVLWTAGVALRWVANVYGWHWRTLLPLSAVLELAAFAIFFSTVSRHRPESTPRKRLDPWIWVVISASAGLMLVLLTNLSACLYLAWSGTTPALPHDFNQRFLALIVWGFLVPFVWGFSSRWIPIFLGIRPVRFRLLAAALAANIAGVALTLAGWTAQVAVLFLASAVLAVAALRVFETAPNEPKTRGVHASFPGFVRIAYGWLLVGALLGAAAAHWDDSGGIWGASRHALTVGFIATMVLCIGQRVLPAFAGMRRLWSPRLMFAGLLLLTAGCLIRVPCEVLAYQEYASWAWRVLPLSGALELAGITCFAVNILGTLLLEPSRVPKQTVVTGIHGAIY